MTAENYGILTAMIAPAVFMAATGSLMSSTVVRMGRIADRIRELVDLGERIARGSVDIDFPEKRKAHVAVELGHLQWRSNHVVAAVTMLYLAFGLLVGSSLAVALDSLIGHYILALPIILAAIGVGLVFGACVHLVLEARCAMQSNGLETQFFNEIQRLREIPSPGPEFVQHHGEYPEQTLIRQSDGG
jgi:Protein of unknown function (DUF2721)